MDDAMKEKEYQCPLCGKRFGEEGGKSRCATCGKGECGMVCCPNCGYEFPGMDTGIARWVRRIAGGGRGNRSSD